MKRAATSLFLLAACGPTNPTPSGVSPPLASATGAGTEAEAGTAAEAETEAETAPGTGLSPDAQIILDAHNRYRADHCAPPLAWSDELERVARDWADRLVDMGCAFEHSTTHYGENLAGGTSGALSPERVVEMWYREVDQYDFKNGGFSPATGHFTQVVWKGTTQLGCAMRACGGLDLWVCNYDPPGNVEGGYKTNVLRGC